MSTPRMNLSANGNTWDFTQETVMVGRESSCDLCISKPKISRNHAVFQYANHSWYLKDLGSTNGTFVNGNKLEPQKTVHIHDGATIDFGNTHKVVFHKGASADLAMPAPEKPAVKAYTPPAPAAEPRPAALTPAGNNLPQPVSPAYPPQPVQAFVPLRCQRNFWKVFFLSLITFGIYGMVVYSHISREINTIASPHDGRRTMHFMLAFLLCMATCGVFFFVWMHKLCNRIRAELTYRGLPNDFGPKTFWLWGVLGSFIVCGTFIFGIRFMRSMNYLAADYNVKGC